MLLQIEIRNDLAAEWTSNNPILLNGEIGLETDTTVNSTTSKLYKGKIGDGTTAWNSLPYFSILSPITISDVTGLDDALAAKADLQDGQILREQIPAIAITEFLGKVSDEEEMLALDGQIGDWCIRQDENIPYILINNDPSEAGNWTGMLLPSNPVITVNGKTGPTVTIAISDLAGLQSALDGKAAVSHTHSIANVIGLATELASKALSSHAHAITDITDLEALLESIDNKTYSEIIRAGSTVPTVTSRWLVPGISSFGTSLVANLVERAIHKDYRVISASSQPGTGSLTITREFTTPTGTVVHTDMLTIPAGSAIGEYVFNTTSFDARSIACNVKYTFFNNATSSSAFIQGLERTFCKIAT